MKLHARVKIPFEREPYLVCIESPDGPYVAPEPNRAIISEDRTPTAEIPTVFAKAGEGSGGGRISLPEELSYLGSGDIVRVNPYGQEIRVLYRRGSLHNCFLLTERCNSRCIMCSQPPREVDDSYLVDELLTALPWISKETREIGLSGGEPTLLGGRLVDALRGFAAQLPQTSVHVLLNARRFADLGLAEAVALVSHPDLMFGIPLYGDVLRIHDFVVQSSGAFDETLLGLINLGRADVPVEIRVVLHRFSVERLPQLARFICANLPFVRQVVLMGLECNGYARTNASSLWIAPRDYDLKLRAAVGILDGVGMRVRIYNHPLCVLDESLWSFACGSISDWKKVFDRGCDGCEVRNRCGGMFDSSVDWFAPLLRVPARPL